MFSSRTWACALSIAALAAPAFSSESGLNTIPTTDTVHYRRVVLATGNSNASFTTPAFSRAPHLTFNSEVGVSRRIEAGIDCVQPPAPGQGSDVPDDPSYELAFNLKYKLKFEGPVIPNVAVGIRDVGRRQRADYYFALSKTLNYTEVQRQKRLEETIGLAAVDGAPDTPTTHHHAQDVFGQRVHTGLTFDGKHTFEPFVGLDRVVNPQLVIQADWIAGPAGALSAGFEYRFRNSKTAINPALLMSNEGRRIDGFVLSISNESKLFRR